MMVLLVLKARSEYSASNRQIQNYLICCICVCCNLRILLDISSPHSPNFFNPEFRFVFNTQTILCSLYQNSFPEMCDSYALQENYFEFKFCFIKIIIIFLNTINIKNHFVFNLNLLYNTCDNFSLDVLYIFKKVLP